MYKSNGNLVGKKVYSVTPKKTNFSYRTKATKSHVDETLFGSPNRFLQQVETKRQSQDADWDPPWATGPTSKGAPLLWTSCNLKNELESNVETSPKSTPQSLSQMRKNRQDSYKQIKLHRCLKEKNDRNFLTSNKFDRNIPTTSTKSSFLLTNQKSNERNIKNIETLKDGKSLKKDQEVANNLDSDHLNMIPVIRSRAGSNLETTSSKTDRVPVCDSTEFTGVVHTETVANALRLANQSKQAYKMIASATNTPLTTPRSSRSSERAASPRIVRLARLSDFTTLMSSRSKDESGDAGDDVLLATGRSLSISARSNGSVRPCSARSNRFQRPSSARSLRSTSSQILSTSGDRSTWKP